MAESAKFNIEVKQSRNGQGIFVTKVFKPGELIYQVKGHLFPLETIDNMTGSFADNCFRFNEISYLSPKGEIGDFQNHSCVPNAKVIKKENQMWIEAIKPIQIEKEVLIDYSTIVAGLDLWSMNCNCGETKCRGFISKFEDLSTDLQQKYIKDKTVPEYILNVIKKLKVT